MTEDILRSVEKRKGAKPGPKPKRKKPEGSGRKPLPAELKRERINVRITSDRLDWIHEEIHRRVSRRPHNVPLPTPSEVIADALDLYRGQGIDWKREFETLMYRLWDEGYFIRELRRQFRIPKTHSPNADLAGDLDGVLERLIALSTAYEQRFKQPQASQPAPEPDEDEPEVFVL